MSALVRIPSCYSPSYCPPMWDPAAAHFSRLQVLHAALLSQPIWRWHSPEAISLDLLRKLHCPDYVDAMLAGTKPLAQSAHLPWSPALVQASLAMLGGQLFAAKAALSEGVALNVACGFHHAYHDRGGGFCVFNGLALVALAHPDLRVVVLDCDEHGGDGTAAFADRLTNLWSISVFGTRFGVRTNARTLALRVPLGENPEERTQAYLSVIAQAIDHALGLRPDLLLYQAGVDMHENDPKATLKLSSETIARRDQQVFATVASTGIPILCSLAGGYQSPEKTALLYQQTTDALASVYGGPNGSMLRIA